MTTTITTHTECVEAKTQIEKLQQKISKVSDISLLKKLPFRLTQLYKTQRRRNAICNNKITEIQTAINTYEAKTWANS